MKRLKGKKVCTWLVCIMFLLMFSGCIKSEEAQVVDDYILSIGEVTLDSEGVIIRAEVLLNDLDEKTRKQVDNEAILIEARNTYTALKVSEVSGLIKDIGEEITYESVVAIEAARTAYDGCNDKVKAGITNYDLLAKAETTYADIIELQTLIEQLDTITYDSEALIKSVRTAYDESATEVKNGINNFSTLTSAESNYDKIVSLQKSIDKLKDITVSLNNTSIATVRKSYNSSSAVVRNGITNLSILEDKENELAVLKIAEVEGLIHQIGTVTLAKKDRIEIAKKAYDALSSTDRKKVGNAGTLNNAINELNKLEKKEEEKVYRDALKRLTTETDNFQGVTWYESSNQPKYANDRCYILPYFGSSHTIDHYWLRIRYHYTGSRWLFYEEIILVIDGEREVLSFDYFDVDRDNGSGDVWETVDRKATDADIELLRRIANSKKTEVRFSGSRTYDFTVKDSDKQAILDVLTVFDYLNK